jgi:hypothetical protein
VEGKGSGDSGAFFDWAAVSRRRRAIGADELANPDRFD